MYRFLESIREPKGTWDSWIGDFHPSDDEGHYDMECSNRGTCDMESGACACYDGYSGSACQRQNCPNGCSGQGTCEMIPSFTAKDPVKLAFTVTTTATSAVAVPSADPTAILSAGDIVRVGPYGRPVKVKYGKLTRVLH